MYYLNGKVALVTGAASRRGYGRVIANRLAQEGADLVVVSRSTLSYRDDATPGEWKGLESVMQEIQSKGRRALPYVCDVTKSDEVDKMVKEVSSDFGQIDILVNNAGVHGFGTIENLSDEVWHRSIAVNLTGTFFCSRAIAREMMKRNEGGRIINVASIFGKVGVGGGNTAYCASKFGVVGFTQSLAMELAPYKILVNAVCPTLSDTDIGIDHAKNEAEAAGIPVEEWVKQMHSKRIAGIPLGRLTTSVDVANMVAFLASTESDFITGQSINVNGGSLVAH